MKIIEILKQRSDNSSDEVKMDLKLYNLAYDLEKRSRIHLKRIITVLSEFDIHDEKHSEKVIENIELLLGEEKLNLLSTYELFLMHLSAFLHDCAMAPSDWEINTMKLTEGNDKHFQNDFSIKYDLRTPLKLSSAIKAINDNKSHLYTTFDSDVKNWMFTPNNEDELIKYLAALLLDYQNYRNGFTDQLKKVQTQREFNELSDFIRIDYIRSTHHTRIETYIKNLEFVFSKAFEQPTWGKKLAHDLALICRSHGEDVNFINSFSTNAQYFGSSTANLQFIAIMLRLGDIIHFSYDRAPVDLRSSRLFKSEYSFQQWAIKSSGVNYSIENGKISFRAYCEIPDTYFKLHEYLDWIEIEIQNYFKFQRQWETTYISNLQDRVDRVNIVNDEDYFLPKRGLNFSLNQKKILELLMGVGLYKDRFACLRELYQNSLDACRCMLSQNEAFQIKTEATIEFNIQDEKGETCLYCIDNGIGMTKEIIENYLLKIGNSYYKSTDFYKQQANWGGKFTPTSQFGIGILSCFMIGDKIEITTKTHKGNYISCAVNGPYEHFYYKKTSTLDKEIIPVSGTIVKVYINNGNLNTINNTKIEKLGLLLLGINDRLPDKYSNYLNYKQNWKTHLYNKINYYVTTIPKNINIVVGLEDGSKLNIVSKPISIKAEDKSLGIDTDDFEFIDYLNNLGKHFPSSHKFKDINTFVENFEICIRLNNAEYRTTFTLPKKEFYFDSVKSLYSIPEFGKNGICIDGIRVDRDNLMDLTNYYSHALSEIGIINFMGELRPQLSVDRTSIIDYPKACEVEAKKISEMLLKEVIQATKAHIAKNNFTSESKEFHLIWDYVFEKIGFADTLFIKKLADTEYGLIFWKNLNAVINETLTIRDFLITNHIVINNFNFSKLDVLTKKLILTKLISAKKIDVKDSNISVELDDLVKSNLIHRRRSHSQFDILLCVDEWEPFNKEFDIISNLYPLIPKRLFVLLETDSTKKINERIKIIHPYSNGLMAFFTQSPLLVNNKLGLYIEDQNTLGIKKNQFYNFYTKRSDIHLFELNDRLFANRMKEKYVLTVYIAPIELDLEQLLELSKLEDTDPVYVKGVKEGWSLLVTSMNKENVVIHAGKTSRYNLVSLISDEFWETNKEYTFRFTDGTIMQK